MTGVLTSNPRPLVPPKEFLSVEPTSTDTAHQFKRQKVLYKDKKHGKPLNSHLVHRTYAKITSILIFIVYVFNCIAKGLFS